MSVAATTQARELPCTGGARPRFERPLLAICEGRVGIVLAVEASRLACNGRAFPAARMKTFRAHRGPLCGRSIEILDTARTLGNGGNPLVFPGRREDSSTARR